MSNYVIIYMLLLTFYLCSYKEVLSMKKYPMNARSELLVKKYSFTDLPGEK